MIKEAIFLPFVFLFTFLVACRKSTIVQPPANFQTTDSVFQDDNSATDAMISVYRPVMQGPSLFNGHATRHVGYYGGEFTTIQPPNPDTGFAKRQLSPSDRMVFQAWKHCYDCINACNRLIKNLALSSKITSTTQQHLTGEAKFMRASSYFYLVNLFGGVPVVTGTDYQTNAGLSRDSLAKVYQLIVDDLKDAVLKLPEHDLAGESLPYRRVRPSQWAAVALLARVYLYLGEWPAAADAASQVINSGRFYLEDSVQDVFQANSRETILQFQTPSGVAAESGFFSSPSTQPPLVQASPLLIDRFDPSDRRRSQWLSSYRVGNKTYYGISKYRQNKSTVQYALFLRLGEVYLNRAEARLRQGNLAGATDDLNRIRSRARASLFPAGAPSTALLHWLAAERHRELFAENGHNLFDLKRWYLEGATDHPLYQAAQLPLSSLFGSELWRIWWPIPSNEIKHNPQLEQTGNY